MEDHTNHIIIPITPNIQPINTVYQQNQRKNKMCYLCSCDYSCGCCNNLYNKFTRLGKSQKYLVLLCLFFSLVILGAFIFALYIGIKICILAC